ncbi:RidA family protein [Leuconostoc koreense]|nr:RidA family protein [Leuconostoc mesenteroides]QGM24859.1 RutC protein [Leuconostoc mesenteroides subsp. mesenteroides]
MSKKVVSTTTAPKELGPYSQAILDDKTLYISGQIGIDPETNELAGATTAEQVHQIFNNIDNILHEAEFSRNDIVKTTLFFDNLADFALVNDIYAKYFDTTSVEELPARSAVQVAALPKNAKLEIEITAMK